MPEWKPSGFNIEYSGTQKNLIAMLTEMLDSASAYAGTLKSGKRRSDALFEQAGSAIATVRRLLGQVEDPAVWQEIHSRADAIEKLIHTSENSNRDCRSAGSPS